jgi:hypothetical protein
LFSCQRQYRRKRRRRSVNIARPNEAPDIEAAHGAPDTESIMDQQLDASCAGIVSAGADPRLFDGEDVVFSFADEQTVAARVSPSAEPRQR